MQYKVDDFRNKRRRKKQNYQFRKCINNSINKIPFKKYSRQGRERIKLKEKRE